MKEKSSRLQVVSAGVGLASIMLSIFLHLLELGFDFDKSPLTLSRVLFATVALTSFSIVCGIDSEKGRKLGPSIFFVVISFLDVILPVIDLMI